MSAGEPTHLPPASTSASLEPTRPLAEALGASGLVLDEPGARVDDHPAPSPRLASLRRAEAWRLLKAHAGTGERHVARALADLARRAPDEAAAVLLSPMAAVLARTGRAREAAPTWALELARRNALGARYPLRDATVTNLALGVELTVGEGALEDGALVLGGGDRIWLTPEALGDHPCARRVIHPLGPGVYFAEVDPNPLAMHEAHPDKAGNALSLGDHPPSAWIDALTAALGLVERHLPSVARDLRALDTVLLPVGHRDDAHLSASYAEYVGAAYLTLHPSPTTLAEAIVHEHQHSKANLAGFHDPLLENAHSTRVVSPVRPDLRPLWGVLLAVHAFVPVAELYLRLEAAGGARVHARLVDVVSRNDEGLATLREHARPTPVGAMILAELEAWHEAHLVALAERGLAPERTEAPRWEG
ncbi:MAG: hypothetical protein KF901_12895 [Myxococcales bacterium]|nr:hypothetical protein [Myxococcales bacterium]